MSQSASLLFFENNTATCFVYYGGVFDAGAEWPSSFVSQRVARGQLFMGLGFLVCLFVCHLGFACKLDQQF